MRGGRRRFAVLMAPAAIAAAAVTSGAPVRAAAPGEPVFTTTVAWSGGRHGEPSISVAGDQVYLAEPTGGDTLYRSLDGGATYETTRLRTGGSGDSDVAVDADGVVYVSDLFGGGPASSGKILPVATSLDHGWTFARVVASARVGSFDRQWTVAEGHGHVINAARLTGGAGGIHAFVSRDAARSFTGPHTIDAGGTMGGPLVLSPDGSVAYMAYARGAELRLARSDDGGDTWTSFHVAALGGDPLGFNTLLFPVAAVDAVGTVSVVWVTGNSSFPTGPVWFARSLDGGTTWSAPVAVSDTESVLMPWAVAAGDGHVAVAWYQAVSQYGDRGPNLGSADTTWNIAMAQSFDARSATPTFTRSTIATAVHSGSICTSGTRCIGPGSFGYVNAPLPFNREVLDFFEIGLDATGHLWAVYPVDRPLYGRNAGLDDIVYANSDLVVARQTGGPTL